MAKNETEAPSQEVGNRAASRKLIEKASAPVEVVQADLDALVTQIADLTARVSALESEKV